MSFPRAPARLPDEFAARIGHCIASFGFLEEALKRCIYALAAQRLGENPGEAALRRWLTRMDDIADDSLGTLIDAFSAELHRHPHADDDPMLIAALRALKDDRNLLCHASWKLDEGAFWRPDFINTRGHQFQGQVSPADLDDILEQSLALSRQVVDIMRRTGIEGQWQGMDDNAPDA
ncbi:MAG: hypothetical protein Q4G24_06215 [Paracoccus sp. (in: a-proteobacteria)]|uniref:hypothetical protein n=1 Tax=Paracoccus sp. TaxID=267 RepID=UPI0026E00B31|nr:hypothetical protein [Paracoccus sp. (in: a-proteobacteria)]MDO5621049.1 hypothetical protein [Paracoccus sp. (in: a-proteobacteria)]